VKITDSHCHPQFPQYDSDREEMIKRNLNQEVFMIAIGADLKSSKEAIELAEKYPERIWGTVGLHPDEINENFKISEFKNLISDKVVAIGEIGLDYYRILEPDKREGQKEVFLEFLNLAKEFKKPVVLHCRNSKEKSAHFDMIEILKSEIENCKLRNENCLQGVAHSFTGNLEEAKAYLDLGFYLGFNGIITFTDQYDEVVRYTPMEQILLETDAPWLAPVPYRGQRNEPRYVIEVAKKIAELKNQSLEKVVEVCNQNCEKLFDFDFKI